ncbi:histone deacetylase family protein [Limibaculum sp. FT325]|uniref:histone deacetylase family protein n=1 Tax=Thermohalobaculum sediminis TaxID=2939436 RepID=UPI0020BED36F|nr:histone deacetylase family protein [Limibaculum sediminis]MCL5778634.1 histone deacetylase family protein [Limibaculum sediminis]
MKTFYDDRQRAHDPKHFLSSGAQQPNPEQPARIDALLGAVRGLGFGVEAPADHGLGPIAAVHTAEYLVFLQTIYTRWQRIEGASAEVIPNIHPDSRRASYPKSAVGQAGWHQADTACPISAETWDSAYWSAQTALSATGAVLAGARAAYALCRPPGHHAFADLAGGFCFLNNSAIAAEAATRAGRRVAVLDVDLHHGNGTQGIFYHRGDVLTVSIHADPERYYPFFWGHAHERGAGAGMGANLNLPIPRGTRDEGFLEALDAGLARIRAFGADLVVVALGLDPFEGDPFAGLAVTTHGFARIGRAIAGLGLPGVIVQEGGYLCPELGANLASFLKGFEGG